MHTILFYLKVVWLVISRPFRKTYLANTCGHHTKIRGRVVSRNESRLVSMSLSKNGNPDYCLDCIAKMSIKCAWCGQPICVGDPVTLYIPKEHSEVPEYAKRHGKCLVGCLRWDCADTGGDCQGFWIPPGKVRKIPSSYETLMPGEEIELLR